MSRLSGNKRTVAIVLGAVLVLMVVLIAATSGFGRRERLGRRGRRRRRRRDHQEDFDLALGQAAARQGVAQNCQGPSPEDPQYETLRDEALNDILDHAWILGEAEERGVEASDREVQEEFEPTKEQNFKTEKEYQDFLEQSCFTQEDVDERVKLQVISTKIQEEITADAAEVPDEDAESSTRPTRSSSRSPRQRNIRLVLNEDPDEGSRRHSTSSSRTTRPRTGRGRRRALHRRLLEGPGRRARVDHRGRLPRGGRRGDLRRPEGEVVGPIETDAGTYVFQVDSITEATTTPFEEARAQIDEQLAGQLQQESFSAFLSDYRDRWVELTSAPTTS